MSLPLFPFADRHPLAAGWTATLALFGADGLATLQQLDSALSVAVRLVAFAVGVMTLAHSLRRWKRGQDSRSEFEPEE